MSDDAKTAPGFTRQRAAIISIAIAGFLILFRPFGISIENWQKMLVLLGFAPLNFVVMIAAHQTTIDGLPFKRFIAPAAIVGANMIYVLFWSSGSAIFPTTIHVLLISALTAGAVVMWNQQRALKREVLELRAAPSDIAPKTIVLRGETENEILRLSPHALLFLKAQGNYVEVNYLSDGVVAQSLLRSTLNGLFEQAGHSSLLRCHRSYIANLDAAIRLVSDKDGMRLEFENALSIPVSRTYRATILAEAKRAAVSHP